MGPYPEGRAKQPQPRFRVMQVAMEFCAASDSTQQLKLTAQSVFLHVQCKGVCTVRGSDFFNDLSALHQYTLHYHSIPLHFCSLSMTAAIATSLVKIYALPCSRECWHIVSHSSGREHYSDS